MKSFFTLFILTALFLASTFTMSFAQNAWDDKFVGMPSVIFDGNTYHMWYTGNTPEPIGSIGYASSADGITWTKETGNPILVHEPYGEWNEQTVYEPSVVFDGLIFHMWYTSSDDPLLPGPIFIHHAISSDGLIWSKDTLNNPVLSPGSNGSWDDVWIDSHCIIYVDSIYHMWYAGTANGTYVRIGHATSSNGVTWTKDPDNPVLNLGALSSWDYPRVEAPNVVFDGNMYHMWYSGGNHSDWRIGYATSQDGSVWAKHQGNLVLNLGTASWDDTWVGLCSVLLDTVMSTYRMWYSGGDTSMINQTPWRAVSQIGYAKSPDGFTWTKDSVNNPILSNVTAINNDIHTGMPDNYTLSQNYPNPFNPSTAIEFSIPKTEFVSLKIHNLLGQEISTLVSERLNAGSYTFSWDATELSSGVYMYKLQAGEYVQTRKMVLIQ